MSRQRKKGQEPLEAGQFFRYIGLQLHRYTRRLSGRIWRLLKQPDFWIGTMLYALCLFIARRVRRLAHDAGGDVRSLARDVSASRSHFYRAV